MNSQERPLEGRIALVAGATRGAGRGIAVALGELGATVICTGRSGQGRRDPGLEGAEAAPGARSPFALEGRPETIEESAALVDAAGGRGIARRVDHTDEAQVAALAAEVGAEHGRLDILVNDIWGGDALVDWERAPWDQPIDKGRLMLDRGLMSHVITCRHAIPLLKRSDRGLIVEITDGDSMAWRGSLFYDLTKTAVIRLAFGLSEALREDGIAAVALTPGFLRSEVLLDFFEVDDATWREAADPHFAFSESPRFVGRALAALAADPDLMARSGKTLSSWGLARDYGLVDLDGQRPDWGVHAAQEPFGQDQRQSHARFLDSFGQD